MSLCSPPLPLEVAGTEPASQADAYRTYEVVDDLVLPQGYTYDLIAAWGDPIADSRYGYNNDYVSYVATGSNQGVLTINFEYISGKTWMQTYELVIGPVLPFEAVEAALANRGGQVNAFGLPNSDPLKDQILTIAKAGLVDQGIGVISVQRRTDGALGAKRNEPRSPHLWYLRSRGRSLSQGYWTPPSPFLKKRTSWATMTSSAISLLGPSPTVRAAQLLGERSFSAEENYQSQVPEPVMADGSALDPAKTPFVLTEKDIKGQGNPLGLAGNKYGWMVEVDPTNPQDDGTKHSWLGRYRHEASGLLC